jgi:hypothetical protein
MDEVVAPQAWSAVPRRAFARKPSLSSLWPQDVVARAQPCRSLQDGLQDTGDTGTCQTAHPPPAQRAAFGSGRAKKPWGTGPPGRERGKAALPRRMGSQGGHREEDTVRVVREVPDPWRSSLGYSIAVCNGIEPSSCRGSDGTVSYATTQPIRARGRWSGSGSTAPTTVIGGKRGLVHRTNDTFRPRKPEPGGHPLRKAGAPKN